jgi:HD-like signal output (HDOD) protein
VTNLLKQVIQEARLKTLPAVYMRLESVLNDPDYSMADVETVINQDPAIAARLLRQVNSAYFGFSTRIDTVSQAVRLLGSQQVHDMVLASSVTQTFEHISIEVMDMHSFWWRSVYCAAAARLLAAQCNVIDSEGLFVAGLLRDIGHLIMYQTIPDQSQQALTTSREECRPLCLAERELLGFDYARVGGALLQEWKLPESLWVPVELHLTPEEASEHALATCIIHMAAILADTAESETESDSLISMVHPAAWQQTGISHEHYAAVRDEVDQQIDYVMCLIFPNSVTLHANYRLG